jgi:thiol:disulfide interchange protein DsbC
MPNFLTALFLGAILISQSALADESVEQRLKSKMKDVIPGAEVTSVRPSPVAGLYEVAVGGDVLYLTENGRFAFKGDLYDFSEHRNLTEERRGQARLNALKTVKRDGMIEFAPENIQHVVHVFTDVDCAYCRKFHREVGELNKAGIAVRYLAFPRAGLDSESYKKTVSVWCTKDRKTALTDAKNGKEPAPATCDNPVKQHYELGQVMGVNGTPTLILENGEEVGGYMPSDKLIQHIARGQ